MWSLKPFSLCNALLWMTFQRLNPDSEITGALPDTGEHVAHGAATIRLGLLLHLLPLHCFQYISTASFQSNTNAPKNQISKVKNNNLLLALKWIWMSPFSWMSGRPGSRSLQVHNQSSLSSTLRKSPSMHQEEEEEEEEEEAEDAFFRTFSLKIRKTYRFLFESIHFCGFPFTMININNIFLDPWNSDSFWRIWCWVLNLLGFCQKVSEANVNV